MADNFDIYDTKKLIDPKIKHETEKAYLIQYGEQNQRQQSWFPMSVVYPEYEEELGQGELLNVYVSNWFLEKEEIEDGVE